MVGALFSNLVYMFDLWIWSLYVRVRCKCEMCDRVRVKHERKDILNREWNNQLKYSEDRGSGAVGVEMKD